MANEPEANRLTVECARIGQLMAALGIRRASKSRPLEILGPAVLAEGHWNAEVAQTGTAAVTENGDSSGRLGELA